MATATGEIERLEGNWSNRIKSVGREDHRGTMLHFAIKDDGTSSCATLSAVNLSEKNLSNNVYVVKGIIPRRVIQWLTNEGVTQKRRLENAQGRGD